MTTEEEIKELKNRIEELEKRPTYIPYYPPMLFPQQAIPYFPKPFQPFHYHGLNPCYNNPCVWYSYSLKE